MATTTCTYVIGKDPQSRDKIFRCFEAAGLGAAWQADSLKSLLPPHNCYPEPHLVLVDISGMNGDLRGEVSQIQEEYPGTAFLLLSRNVTSSMLMEYMPCGIGGVLPLDIEPDMLRHSLALLLDDSLVSMN
jgi:DNA-binding NarL/FixJ family response regulator